MSRNGDEEGFDVQGEEEKGVRRSGVRRSEFFQDIVPVPLRTSNLERLSSSS